jgi:hypothetical protein
MRSAMNVHSRVCYGGPNQIPSIIRRCGGSVYKRRKLTSVTREKQALRKLMRELCP